MARKHKRYKVFYYTKGEETEMPKSIIIMAQNKEEAVEKCKDDKSKSFASIVSVIYLTLFSMTVPVCYLAFELGSLTIPFYVSEFLAAFVLIPVFGVMLYNFFKDGVAGFSVVEPAELCCFVVFLVTVFVGFGLYRYVTVALPSTFQATIME